MGKGRCMERAVEGGLFFGVFGWSKKKVVLSGLDGLVVFGVYGC